MVLNLSDFVTSASSQALYQMLQTTKMKYGKLLSLPRLTICILRHNPPPWIALAR